MKVICYGDSNTYGYDPRSYFGSRYEEPWPELLARETGWVVVNQGDNGREIPMSNVTFMEDTDLVIVMLGTNDLLQSGTSQNIGQKMKQFLISLNLPKEKVLLIAPPPMKYGEWVWEQRLIDESVSVADVYQALAQDLGICFADAGQWNIPLSYDGVHFTQEGHRDFARQLYHFLVMDRRFAV